MVEEESQPQAPHCPEPVAPDLQFVEELPYLQVQSTIDRWKRGNVVKDPGPRPRFGIRHIMAWTACWGIYVAIVRHFLQLLQQDHGLILLMLWALSGVGSSADLLGLSVFITRRVRGFHWPIEPGEWLLVSRGLQFLCAVALATAAQAGMEVTVRVWFRWMAMPNCALYMVPLFLKSFSKLWKCLFLLLLTVQVTSVVIYEWFGLEVFAPDRSGDLLVYLARQFVTYDSVLVALLPILFAAIDFRRRGKYSWMHWLGMAAGFFEAVAHILWRFKSDLG